MYDESGYDNCYASVYIAARNIKVRLGKLLNISHLICDHLLLDAEERQLSKAMFMSHKYYL